MHLFLLLRTRYTVRGCEAMRHESPWRQATPLSHASGLMPRVVEHGPRLLGGHNSLASSLQLLVRWRCGAGSTVKVNEVQQHTLLEI